MKWHPVGLILLFHLLPGMYGGAMAQELKTVTYPDGTVRYRGHFKDGKPVGEWLRYYPDGGVQARMNHRGDTVDAVLYSRDGTGTSAGRYVKKLKTGTWAYRKGERLLVTEQYAGGQLEGEAVRYFASGSPAERKQWRRGHPEGEWVLFYNNGRVRMQASFVAGKLDGEVKTYSYEGRLRTEGTYRENRKEGVWKFYDEQGKVKRELEYRGGVPEHADQMIGEESRKLDELLEKGKKIPDPAAFADDPDLYMQVTGME